MIENLKYELIDTNTYSVSFLYNDLFLKGIILNITEKGPILQFPETISLTSDSQVGREILSRFKEHDKPTINEHHTTWKDFIDEEIEKLYKQP